MADFCILGGFASVVAGLWWLHPAAAGVVGGAGLMLYGFAATRLPKKPPGSESQL